MSDLTNIGILGCGLISTAYLQRLTAFDAIDVVACADLVPERAASQAEAFGVAVACSPDELLANPDVEVVVNLTIPAVHAALSGAALDAGKSVYGEKPLALTRADGLDLLARAAAAGRRLGSAPDTFLGAGLQTCRALLDEGAIGEPLGACAFMMGAGPESWHPDPAFFYKAGAGPMFDVGVYYVTALVTLLGPARRVSASARISRAERTITSQPLHGTAIAVEVPTHVAAVVDLAGGPVATVVTSFDVHASELPRMEIYGTEGTLSVPDPNTFGGPVRVRRAGDTEWRVVPLRPGYSEQSRGIGVADMVLAAREGRPHRASGELALHVLDIMQSVHEASDQGSAITLTTTCTRPEPFS
ncbi:MAG TPA: Gfo/Idh/MocA family oxidoreductase [Acidimicrobiales bacterium]|nr:Gfo/Idh/MocA family oxidoreductase [Acidimicrobiales bacterium]